MGFEGSDCLEILGKNQACSETRLKHVRKYLARLAVGLGDSHVSSLDAMGSSVFCTLVGPKRRSASAPSQGWASVAITGEPGRGDMDVLHKPVMVLEVLAALEVASEGTYIDLTVGEGGHAEAILDAVSPTPRLLGFDLDASALDTSKRRLERFGDRVTLVQGSYAGLGAMADGLGLGGISGVLMDLGLSSLQLGTDERGFSFARTGKLDMRFDGKQDLTADAIVNTWSEQELADSIYRLGEERASRRIARAIVRARPLSNSTELAKVVAGAAGRTSQDKVHPATRTFQAIRMAVNGELENVQAGLVGAVETLQQGGRLVVISYHSLEDRLVKGFLRTEASQCVCPPETPVCVCGHEPTIKLVRRRVIKPSNEEIGANPRARSARLRVAEKL